MSAVNLYVAAVAVSGLAVLVAVAPGAIEVARDASPAFWFLVALCLAAEPVVLDIPTNRAHRIVASGPFAFALTIVWGIGPGVVVHGLGSLVSDCLHRVPPRKAAFNVGLFSLGLGASGSVFRLLGGAGHTVTARQLLAVGVAGVVFASTNTVLTRIVVALDQGRPVLAHLAGGPQLQIWIAVVDVALATVTLLVSETPALLFLIPVPLAAVWVAFWIATRAEAEREAADEARRVLDGDAARLRHLLATANAVVQRGAATEQDRREVLSVLAHELGTPLSGVLAGVRTLRRHAGHLPPDQREELFDHVELEAEQLMALLRRLLQDARPRSLLGGAVAEHAVVDLAALVQQAVRTLGLTQPDRRTIVEVAEPLRVAAAPETVLEILANLLSNAVKYSPDETSIWLEACRRGIFAVISVEDEGRGIPRDDRERIFDRYARIEATAAEPGLGLGLYLARKLARAQGGDLVAVDPSRPGGGARFELRLPIAAAEGFS